MNLLVAWYYSQEISFKKINTDFNVYLSVSFKRQPYTLLTNYPHPEGCEAHVDEGNPKKGIDVSLQADRRADATPENPALSCS